MQNLLLGSVAHKTVSDKNCETFKVRYATSQILQGFVFLREIFLCATEPKKGFAQRFRVFIRGKNIKIFRRLAEPFLNSLIISFFQSAINISPVSF
jgi:hypothetical protein